MIYWVLGIGFTLAGLIILLSACLKMSAYRHRMMAEAEAMRGLPRGENRRRGEQKIRRQWKLILEDVESWEQYSFVFYDAVAIGRGKSVEAYEESLSLGGDVRVSKIHCLIKSKNDKLFLVDMESRNGTKLNGERIDRPVVIHREDVIKVGKTQLEIVKILREKER